MVVPDVIINTNPSSGLTSSLCITSAVPLVFLETPPILGFERVLPLKTMPLENQLLVGLTDLFDPHWQTTYFPEECPGDWRATYYSNDFRGAWLGMDFWQHNEGQRADYVAAFIEDGDSDFYFLISLGSNELKHWATCRTSLRPIAAQIAAYVINTPAQGAWDEWLTTLSDWQGDAPVAVQVLSDSLLTIEQKMQLEALLHSKNWSLVWHAEDGQPPFSGGQFLPVLGHACDLRALRYQIEQLGNWMGAQRSAGLFFAPKSASAELALSAKELAELMGV